MAIWKRPFYKRWKGMIDNTTNPNVQGYKNQGAKGIRVDKAFLNYLRFEEYVLTHLGPPRGDRRNLIRIDKKKHWAPGNIAWADNFERSWHRHDNFRIKYKNKTKPLAEWCYELDIPYMRTFNRIYDYGWSVKDAFEIRENVK